MIFKANKIKNLATALKNHWGFGGILQVSRLIYGLFAIYCGELYFRSGKSQQRYCSCCGWVGRRFRPYRSGGYTSLDAECPNCQSHGRHRGHVHYYSNLFKRTDKQTKVLYFAPEKGILQWLKETSPDLNIETSDFEEAANTNYHYNIMNIHCEDGVFDYILCHRVIEHVSDDRKAMQEIYRVLKPGGTVVISVPITRTRENTLDYGKPNPLCDFHFYDYGLDFSERIPKSFEWQEILFSEFIDAREFKRLALSEDSIFECRKP